MNFFGGFPFGGGGGGGFHFSHDHDSDSPDEVENTRYYELLGVPQSATTDEIRKAYRKLAIKKHPDRGGDPEEFVEINQAYEVLSDENKRKLYDQYGEEGMKGGMGDHGEGVDLMDLLMGNLGGRPKNRGREGPKRGEDMGISLKVTLEDIYNGKVSQLPVTHQKICKDCNGEGGKGATKCRDCDGKGRVVRMTQIGPGMYSQSVGPCDKCQGGGVVFKGKNKCKTCKGKRVVTETKTIEVQVDKGVPNHHKYSFHGEADEAPGVLPGDLVVIIEEAEHELFKRKKADLILTKKISLKEALTGYVFTIPFLDGTEKLIKSMPGEIIKPGDVKTVRELGMPLMRTPFKFGNLFIYFEVEFPVPGSLNEAGVNQLRNILPGEAMDIDAAAFNETHETIPFEKSQVTENATSIHSDYKEDEEDEEMQGRGKMQCSGTLF